MESFYTKLFQSIIQSSVSNIRKKTFLSPLKNCKRLLHPILLYRGGFEIQPPFSNSVLTNSKLQIIDKNSENMKYY